MNHPVRDTLVRQLDIAWALTQYHLDGLTTDECLWRPAHAGLHVEQAADGTWRAGWPEHERYDLGPASIAWLTWHLGMWLSIVLDHSFADATLTREQLPWPGDAERTCAWIRDLQARWRAHIEQLGDDDLQASERTRWPFQDRAFADIVAWATVELTKNAAEIGYARFLYAVRSR